ncbi:alpha/beta hydrolase [Luteimonas endophytica]
MVFRALLLVLLLAPAAPAPAATIGDAAPLAIGETFTIESQVLGETRRINVYRAPGYGAAPDAALPVLYMPDGGIGEDFLHVAGLVQVSVMNGTMRPFMVVGIENTERRRDLTGPTDNAEDRKIAPRVGGSAAFRAFLRDELMPAIDARYATSGQTAIVGESLAGLFVVETFLLAPGLFDQHIAIDPSLWWNDGALLEGLDAHLGGRGDEPGVLFLAHSGQVELAAATARLAWALRAAAKPELRVEYAPMPGERHQTIYHPAALGAFRALFEVPGDEMD